MELFPEISFSLIGGWLLTIIYLVINLGIPLMKRGALKRLFAPAKNYTTFIEKILYLTAQLSWFGTVFLPVIYAIKTESGYFILGIILFMAGMIFTIISLLHYVTTPLKEPITKGLYRFSRNPIYASYNILGFGFAVLTGSWLIMILHITEIITCHLMVLDEEKFCAVKYGKEYQSYFEKVPRYYFGKF